MPRDELDELLARLTPTQRAILREDGWEHGRAVRPATYVEPPRGRSELPPIWPGRNAVERVEACRLSWLGLVRFDESVERMLWPLVLTVVGQAARQRLLCARHEGVEGVCSHAS